MTYKELSDIANENIDITTNNLPQSAFEIAQQLNIRIKNSTECKQDYHTIETPLLNCNAIYALNNGEYTIYHNENYAYKNFSIAHEIAHHLLGHTSDGAAQHHDANLLASIIIAPKRLVHARKIKNAVQLSETCKIPIDIAEMYWKEIHTSKVKKVQLKSKPISSISIVIIIIITLVGLFLTNPSVTNSQLNNTYINESDINIDNIPVEIKNTGEYYVTSSGTKYHLKNCKYLKNKSNVRQTSDPESEGYSPCSFCIK